jgi:thiosulfate/3-mercaptopyruvate sulfurtransferase
MNRQATASPLISPEDLTARLSEPDILVLDVRPGREAFEAGHVPGAVHSDYAADGWRVARGGAGGLLPDADALSALFGRLGLRPEDHVVVVSAGASANDFNAAARVYWTLKVAGQRRISVLDGGYSGWTRDPSRPVETGPAQPRPASDYPVTIDAALRAEVADVERAIERGSAALVDARGAAAYEGREKSAQARIGGRLPGAVLADFTEAYDPGANRLKSRDELQRLFAKVPEGEAISYCNTGHSAAGDWFVLSEILGRPGVKLYDGSMTEWTHDPARPVEIGPAKKAEPLLKPVPRPASDRR